MEEEIKRNKQTLKVLRQENWRAQALNEVLDLKLINRANKAGTRGRTSLKNPEKKLARIEKKLKLEMQRSEEINCWGLHNHIISHVVKIRLLEDLIVCA